jgi:SNF2 family DNA or RNA helicase
MHKNLPHEICCKEVSTHISAGGFTASAKIKEAIKWYETAVPPNDKAIFLSFFKGSLDLIEGILVSQFGTDCARYDGDVSKELRTRELQRFKTSSTCRVLLATVQSGGTGLNITEANHICFLDRWFNPCVHDQAESRCHRIGQTKDVNVAYLDINSTVDIAMRRINVLKAGNAKVILADGTSLGDSWSLGYRDVSGQIGNTMKALKRLRDRDITENGDKPLLPCEDSVLERWIASSKLDEW